MRKIYFYGIIIFILIASLTQRAEAQNITQHANNTYVTAEQAQHIGYTFMRNKMQANTPQVEEIANERSNSLLLETMQLVYTGRVSDSLTRTSTNCYYVYALQPKGFVIVSADERTEPILGYSCDNDFEAENMPEHLRAWLVIYEKQIKAVIDRNLMPTSDINSKWSCLKSGQTLSTRNANSVSHLLNTTWHQNYPYNMMCPEDANGPGGYVYAGCVACAMAQIMRYWESPTSGIGSHSYNCDHASQGYGNYGTLSANFGATTYNYSLMPTSINSNSPQNQINEVAKLMYHCGVAVNMMYNYDGSYAYHNNAVSGLSNYFGYTNATRIIKSNYTESNWITLLKEELNQLRPMYYAGESSTGAGHAFVCDGYDNLDYFHFNWGWGGKNNGYYLLTSLNPGTYEYNNYQSAITNIYVSQPMMHPNTHLLTFLTEQDSICASKSVSIISTSLTNPITATVTGNFRISSDNANFSTSQTLNNTGGTLYVRHQPTSAGMTDHGYLIFVSSTTQDSILLVGNTINVSCNPPRNLHISSSDLQHIDIQWTAPQYTSAPQNLSWSTNTIATNYGYTSSAYKVYMMQRYCDTDLVAIHNKALTSIRFYARNAATLYRAIVYKGGSFDGEYNPGNLVLSQDIDLNSINNNGWNTITLNTPIIIDATQELWFGIYVEAPAGTYVMPVCSSSVATKGSIRGYHTDTYTEWAEFSTIYSYCLTGIVNNLQTPTDYQILRDGTIIDNTSNTTLQDYVTNTGTFHYTVIANWSNGCSASVQGAYSNAIQIIESVDTCDFYIWHDTTYYESGTYSYSHPDINGHIQVDTLYLTIENSVTIYDSLTCTPAEMPYDYYGNMIPEAGDYIFTGTTANGCDSTTQLHVTVNQVGIVNVNNAEEIRIFPNPTNGELTIKGIGLEQVEVLDIIGRTLQTIVCQTTNNDELRINLSSLAEGVYTLHVTTSKGRTIKKVVKR